MRVLVFIIFVFCLTSCDYFSFKRNKNQEKINTEVDTTSVDTPPSFEVCNSIIDKEEKTDCFRKTIHKEISTSLSKQSIQVKKSVNETIEVVIVIQADNKAILKSLKASDILLKQIPDIKEKVEKSIQELPKILAATKRGIPVTSEYTLPIKIQLEN
ncbi:hypothetical protein AAON49_14110 [Pseudotenacibaculum sp. MALMAid0570]|uniref:hypothetical protein n=1 Tax=Pseudotenacibaculum sp. MALMAid0570 TaxID=3143938 RepID=UPI0032DE3C32